MTDLPVLKIKGLAKHFGHIKAVDGLNLHVSKGEIFGLLGHNGAGKSTTMRMLLSLIKPTSGRIEVFGSELYSNREKILSDIGSIIEKPDFYPWLSAKTNLELFAALSRKPVSKNRISQTLEFVGLAARAGDKVKTYSHGMKQRLGLAQAIVHDPALIILDEPSNGLDPKGIIELRELILHLKNDLGKTVILSSHILSEVELIADSMAIIHNGRTIIEGSVAKLLSDENLLVRFFVSNPAKAKSAIESSVFAGKFIEMHNNELILELNNQDTSRVIRLLLDSGNDLQQVISRRRLEEYFLKITSAAS